MATLGMSTLGTRALYPVPHNLGIVFLVVTVGANVAESGLLGWISANGIGFWTGEEVGTGLGVAMRVGLGLTGTGKRGITRSGTAGTHHFGRVAIVVSSPYVRKGNCVFGLVHNCNDVANGLSEEIFCVVCWKCDTVGKNIKVSTSRSLEVAGMCILTQW